MVACHCVGAASGASRQILNRSGLGNNKAVRSTEVDELQVNEVSLDEIRKRQGQLAKLKALLFYDELKRRRANKIKSKAYRRVRKRQNKRKEDKQREVRGRGRG